MARQPLLLLLVLALTICFSLASELESGPELIAVAIRARTLYGRYLKWKRDQPAESDTSFATFYDSIKPEAANRQLAQRVAADDESSQTFELGHDNGELQHLYKEWRDIQPEGSSDSFVSYLEWLKDQRTTRELSADSGNDAVDDAAIGKRACDYYCTCCPIRCGIRC